MRNRERNRRLLAELGQHLGLEPHVAPASRRHKRTVSGHAVAEIEWRLALAGRVNIALVRQFVPNFPESLPLVGFVFADDSDRPARQFAQFASVAGERYPAALLVSEDASTYRRAHRSLRTFRYLFGASDCLVADMQQLQAVARQMANESGGDSRARLDEQEPQASLAVDEAVSSQAAAAKTWTRQLKTLLRQKGREAGFTVSENAVAVDFSRQFDSGREAFATLQRYLQPVLLEEVGHALGYYYSLSPLNNRPPRVTASWQKQFAAIKTDVIWQLAAPDRLQRFLDALCELDLALRYAAPLLQGQHRTLPLVGFVVERSIAPPSAGRVLMLGCGCRFGVVITPQSQCEAAQEMLAMLGRTIGLANIRVMARQQVLEIKE